MRPFTGRTEQGSPPDDEVRLRRSHRRAQARSSCEPLDIVEAGDLERHRAEPQTIVSTPSASHAPICSRTCSTCRPAGPSRNSSKSASVLMPGGEAHAVARSGVGGRLRRRRRARRARVCATPSPDRDRSRRTRASSDVEPSRYASGVHAQHVFHPSACSATSRSSRSPLPPTNTRGRGCLQRGRQVHRVRARGGSGRRT